MKENLGLFDRKIDYWNWKKDYVVFQIGLDVFATKLENIKEIVKKTDILTVNELPNFINGFTNIRGEIFPVFDLKNHSNQKEKVEYGKYSVIIILIKDNEEMALLADNVIDIYNIPDEQLVSSVKNNEKNHKITPLETTIDNTTIKFFDIKELFKLKDIV